MSTRKATARAAEGAEARPPKASKKRAQDIIDAAAEIFHNQGYAETSVHDIAEAVGILKGSLYYYIKSKEELLFQVLSDVHEGFRDVVERTRTMDAPAVERLRAYVREHVIYNTRNVTKMAVFYHDYRSLSEERLEEIKERRRFYEDYVRELIEEAQAEGSVDRSHDPKLAAFTLFGMMNWVYHWYRPDGGWTPSQIGDQVAAMAVEGLVGPGRQAQPANGRRGRPAGKKGPATRK
jgi:TetR/AcrR family transcriptional regulator, cholesterol catabolism regulator